MAWLKFLTAVVTAIQKAETIRKAASGAYRALRNWWKGKTIAVIGPTASGKNSMFERLQKKAPPAQHVQTRGAEQIETFKLSYTLPDKTKLELKCKSCVNVGGEIDERERYWQQACLGADVIFYLIDGDKLRTSPTQTLARIGSDLDWLVKNVNAFKPDFVLHLLLNKVDVVTAGLTTDLAVAAVSKEFGKPLKKLEELVRAVLGAYFGRVTGLGPISILDDTLFHRYFPVALQQIHTQMGSRK